MSLQLFLMLQTFLIPWVSFVGTLSNIDEVLSINPSANVFLLGDFIAHHKDLLTYAGRTDRPSELCYNFPI